MPTLDELGYGTQLQRDRAKAGSRAAAIRLKCLDCCAGNAAEVKRCHLTTCALHAYRHGFNPYRKRPATKPPASEVPRGNVAREQV